MEIKWTPWRSSYIKGDSAKEDQGCPLCSAHQAKDDAQRLVLYRGSDAYVLMNLYPYNPGHLMIVPYKHTAEFDTLPAETAAEIMQLGQISTRILTETMQPHGFNLGMNFGRAAGAGVADHFHLHIMPRWIGDTNFMTTVGETRVHPEDLATTYKKLRGRF